jgi:thymidylate kinase
VFLASRDFSEFLHIDLFDRLEWHFIEYASTAEILRAREWNGMVFHPSPGDECYLNLVTRLIYHGKIRDKHRLQFEQLLQNGHEADLRQAFIRNLGTRAGGHLMDTALAGKWPAAESMARDIRRSVIFRHGICCPLSLAWGVFRYISRSLARLIRPPGPFIIFEGADGVGKSSVIDQLHPFFKNITGRTDTLLFHWKPSRDSLHLAGTPAGPAMNPRSKSRRSSFSSILFLAYHWLGFWAGYLRFVLPARSRNRAVVGDRYAYEFFLDPARLRLTLPDWLARVAASTVPQPDLVLCLSADADRIIARKPELGKDEILQYQTTLEKMARNNRKCAKLEADGDVEHVVNQARTLILKKLLEES